METKIFSYSTIFSATMQHLHPFLFPQQQISNKKAKTQQLSQSDVDDSPTDVKIQMKEIQNQKNNTNTI